MEYIYKPKGVCSNLITIELDGEIIPESRVHGWLQWKWPVHFAVSQRT